MKKCKKKIFKLLGFISCILMKTTTETVVAMLALHLNPQWSKLKGGFTDFLFPTFPPPITVLFAGTSTCYENMLTTGTNR